MTKRKDILFLYVLVFIELIVLMNSKTVIQSVIVSSSMFVLNIFPSLFPTMTIGLCLVNSNVFLVIPSVIKKTLKKLCNFDDNMTSIFIMSMIAGTPSNAVFINSYLSKGLISEKTAQNLLCCTHFVNPLFVIGAVGLGVFNSTKIGIILLSLIYLSNLIKAMILRKNFISVRKDNEAIHSFKPIETIKSSIKSAINSLLVILGIIIMFNILVTLISKMFLFSGDVSCVINGLLEMTGGIIKLKSTAFPYVAKILLAYYFLSFGGFSIQMQALSMMEKIKIKYVKYFIFRLF